VEGQALRDRADEFESRNVVVLGASFDSTEDNRAFARAQRFPFPLLSDEDATVGAAYEVARPEGDRYVAYPRRLSYLIDPDGVIRRAYDVTDVAAHADDVLADLDHLTRVTP
jgi:thioredoxin-dependent peroxiredoxin